VSSKPESPAGPTSDSPNSAVSFAIRRPVLFRKGQWVSWHNSAFVIEAPPTPDGHVVMSTPSGADRFNFRVSDVQQAVASGDAHFVALTEPPSVQLPFLDEAHLVTAWGKDGGPIALNEDKVKRVARKMAYVLALDALGRHSWKSKVFTQTINDKAKAINDPSPPSRTTAYDWLRAYRKCGRDAQVFMSMLFVHRPRGERTPGLRELLEVTIDELHRESKVVTVKDVRRRLEEKLAYNRARLVV